MTAVIFIACVLLLSEQGASSEAGAKSYLPIKGCALGKSQDANIQTCEKVTWSDMAPRTCKDVRCGEKRTVVKLADGLVVLCDTETDGGGWLVFQRRVSADVDFYRNWDDYKNGFGFINGNFWLGNEKIHRLTFQRPHELRVDITFNGKSYFARYSKFRILGEAEKYKLFWDGYSGNAGNSLNAERNMLFTTLDRDNDKSKYNCAKGYHGAWWYHDCHNSNLNGLWGSKVYGVGLNWLVITGHQASATSTEMKIRPLD